jgi:hypothetical protein
MAPFGVTVLIVCGVVAVLTAADTINITVVLPMVPLGPVIASDYASFSFETNRAHDLFTFQSHPRPSLVNLMRVLWMAGAGGADSVASHARMGPNIRIGGSSADVSAFVPASDPLPDKDTYRLTQADMDSYVTVSSWNGTITPGLNFRDADSATLALAHLKALTATLSWTPVGPLLSVEIGNGTLVRGCGA